MFGKNSSFEQLLEEISEELEGGEGEVSADDEINSDEADTFGDDDTAADDNADIDVDNTDAEVMDDEDGSDEPEVATDESEDSAEAEDEEEKKDLDKVVESVIARMDVGSDSIQLSESEAFELQFQVEDIMSQMLED